MPHIHLDATGNSLANEWSQARAFVEDTATNRWIVDMGQNIAFLKIREHLIDRRRSGSDMDH
jgi:hypothetical protein